MERLSFNQSSVSEHCFTPQGFFAFFYVLCRRQSIPVQVKWDTTKQSTSGSPADTLRFKRSANKYLKFLTKLQSLKLLVLKC